jgi:hypothetical protein
MKIKKSDIFIGFGVFVILAVIFVFCIPKIIQKPAPEKTAFQKVLDFIW